jgi:Tol biopolymer transport system component
MKLVTAVVSPASISAVKAALHAIGITRVTIVEAQAGYQFKGGLMKFRRYAGVAVLGVVLSAPPLTISPAHAGTLAKGTIAFAGNRDGNSEIYVMNADGSNPIRLTNSVTRDQFPVLSPDGKRILWHTNRDGNFEIYSMNADGSDPVNLTNAPGLPNAPADDTNADWSPNGKSIAFSSTRDGNTEIYVMDADGSNQTRLTDSAGADRNPDWSPNGKRLLFNTDRDVAGNAEIYVMGADGSDQTRLTFSAGSNDTSPAWSPNGKRIAFDTNRDVNYEIYVMDADGTNPVRIPGTPQDEEDPLREQETASSARRACAGRCRTWP